MKKTLGLIVNPIAGMGGRVGLKGTDGADTLARARDLGASPLAPVKVMETLKELSDFKDQIQIITCPGEMGEREARECGFFPCVLEMDRNSDTTPQDTINAAREMIDRNVDLLLFAGGDGTARNIHDAVGDRIPAVGIPTGVKMHSGVYAVNPRTAAEIVRLYLFTDISLRMAEVMDIDEEAYRNNQVSAHLYGYLKVPNAKRLVQNMKARSSSERSQLDGIAQRIVEDMDSTTLYLLAPGTTTRSVAEKLGLEKSLLGVDVVLDKKLVAKDVNETGILELIQGKSAKIIVTPIGGQGYVFGRGNQQLSANVIRAVGAENVIVIAGKEKILDLKGEPLLVDTGDPEVNSWFNGYVRVQTGYNDQLVCKIQG